MYIQHSATSLPCWTTINHLSNALEYWTDTCLVCLPTARSEIKSIHSHRRQMPTMLLTSAWYQSRDFTATLTARKLYSEKNIEKISRNKGYEHFILENCSEKPFLEKVQLYDLPARKDDFSGVISQFQPLLLRNLQQAMQRPPTSARDKSKHSCKKNSCQVPILQLVLVKSRKYIQHAIVTTCLPSKFCLRFTNFWPKQLTRSRVGWIKQQWT